jgi:FtsP/CotA-like multicopper oxidase with cupredoxin domain
MSFSRRNFLKMTGALAGSTLVPAIAAHTNNSGQTNSTPQTESAADYTIKIDASPIEIAPKRIISTTTYNGQFPGLLLRFKEGRQVTVDIYNETDTPEQVHWHGQMVPVEVDGAAEEGTPFVPAHGFITPIIGLAPISLPGSTAARLARCTSSPPTSPEIMTAKSSLC